MFLLNFSFFKSIKRSTLDVPQVDGGIALPCIGLKTSTAFLWQLIHLLQTPKPLQNFWMHFAIYNLGTKLIPYKPDFYFNSQPNLPKPNSFCKKTSTYYKKFLSHPTIYPNLLLNPFMYSFLNLTLIPY